MLVRLLYASRAVDTIDDRLVKSILESSRLGNPEHGITGLLCVTILLYTEILERRFASWRMGSVDLKRVNLSTILRFSERPVLAPFSMSGQAALALLEELAETAAIVSREP